MLYLYQSEGGRTAYFFSLGPLLEPVWVLGLVGVSGFSAAYRVPRPAPSCVSSRLVSSHPLLRVGGGQTEHISGMTNTSKGSPVEVIPLSKSVGIYMSELNA